MASLDLIRAALCVAALLTCAGAASAHEIDASAALVSDYRWRGVSLSDEKPSLQLEGTVSFANGAWLWAGLNSVSPAYGGSEIGLGAGYTKSIAGIDWTVSALRYVYAGEDNIDYSEIDANAARKLGPLSLMAGVEYVPEQSGYEEDELYGFANVEWAAAHSVTLHAHAGWDDGVMAPTPHAFDYSVGAGVPVGPVAFDLTYFDVESVDPAWVLKMTYRL